MIAMTIPFQSSRSWPWRFAAMLIALHGCALVGLAQKHPNGAEKALSVHRNAEARETAPIRTKNPAPPSLPAPVVERFRKMTPEQREKALAKLPPDRRAVIEQRLNRIQQLPPLQRGELEARYQRFQNLPAERRLAVRQELQNLRGLPPAERRRRFVDPGFQQEYSSEEQQILRESLGQGGGLAGR